MMDLRTAASLLGGKVNGRGINCPGRGHSARDESISVIFSPSAPDGLLVFDHAGGDHLAAKDYVRERLGLEITDNNAHSDFLGAPKVVAAPRHVEGGGETPPAFVSDHTALALRLWREAQPAAGSPVERYLACRGLSLPDDPDEVLRFHPNMPFAGTRTLGMVALVRSVTTDAPQSVHRTALDLEGNKILVKGRDRLALGPLAGGAVKLSGDAEVTLCVGLAEGIETALSLQHLPEFGRSPVWACINAAGLAAFPVLAGIETIWIAADHDPAGEKAAQKCAGRWRFAGKEALVVKATAPGNDINDVLTGVRDA